MGSSEIIFCLLILMLGCSADYDAITMGPVEPVLRAIQECPDHGNGDVRISFKLRRISRTELSLQINVTSHIILNDSLTIHCSAAQFTNGGWKENYFVKDFPGMCTIAKTIVPDMMRNLAIAAGYPHGDKCPISPKNYTVKNFKVQLDFGRFLPIFTYSKYRSDVSLVRKGTVHGCIRIFVDLVPKRRDIPKKKKKS